ncbi:MAG: tetratricopeptide repeat protein [Pseudomonadota bacterium]
MIRRSRLSSPTRLTALFAALTCAVLPQALNADEVAPAVPEFIDITDADLATPLGADLDGLQNEFRANVGVDAARALELAKEIVALTAEAYGEDHDNLARALTNLAIVQAENTEYAAAIENYRAAIISRERVDGTLVDGELINPLRGLANAFMALNEIDAAIPVYERAIHISHVNEGPNNLDQVEIIDALSRAYFFQGDLDTASDMQDTIFRLRQRRFTEESDQYIDALIQRATWFSRLGDFEEAVQAYRRLERSISKKHGSDSPRLIEPLVALATAAISITDLGEPAINEGRRAMARAVRIARNNGEEDPERLARTLVKQGDWLSRLNLMRNSRLPYREAWRTMDANPELHGLRDELFGSPVPILRVPFRSIYGQRVNESADTARFPQRGYADVAFDVDPLGRPLNVRIVGGNPPGLMDGHLRRQIRRFRFRPAFRGGQPVVYTGLAYRHPFRYDESRFTDRERKTIATTTYGEEPGSDETAAAPIRRNVNLDPRRDEDLIGRTISVPTETTAPTTTEDTAENTTDGPATTESAPTDADAAATGDAAGNSEETPSETTDTPEESEDGTE